MKPPKKSLSDRPDAKQRAIIAERHGLSERTLRRYEKEGVDLWDDAEIEAKKAAPESNEDVKRLKVEKLVADTRHKQAQAERAELLLAQTRGELVSISTVAEKTFEIATATKAKLMRLEAELPPRLEGLKAKAMQAIIKESIHAVLEELAEELGALGAEAPALPHDC